MHAQTHTHTHTHTHTLTHTHTHTQITRAEILKRQSPGIFTE